MYKWTIKHRQSGGANVLNPLKVTQGYYWLNDNRFSASHTAYTEKIKVTPSQVYQANGTNTSEIVRYVTFYDSNEQYLSDINTGGYFDNFTVPSGAYYMIVTIISASLGQEPKLASLSVGLGTSFEPYFTSREVKPVYKKMGRGYDKESNYQFYREKLDGNLKLVRYDYDYVAALGFDQQIYLEVEDITGIFPTFLAQFYKTDCKWNSDDRIVEIKTEPADDYEDIMAGLDKTFNIIQEAPELQEITLRRRPIIQVYIPGDKILTNILGGTYWEQEIQIDPEFDHNTLVNTYKFANPKNIRNIPTSYGPVNNLFNQATAVLNEKIDSTTGNIASQTDWWRSDWIKVDPNTDYSAINQVKDRAYYDASRIFLSGASDTVTTFTTPADARWIRFSHSTIATNPPSQCMFNEGNTALPFESYSSTLSEDVTGEYDSNRDNVNGLYRIVEETDNSYFNYNRYRYAIQRTADNVNLYQTAWTNWQKPSINTLIFNGINGSTGSFYFTEYRVYVRYYTDLLDVRGTSTYAVPATDIVANNQNYRRVIGYNIDDFYTYDQFVTYPTKFGKVPEGAPDAGKYYKEFLVSVATGLSNPLPVGSSSWRAVSLWFFNNLDIRYTEFIDGQDVELRDAYPLHSVIITLLKAIGSTVRFENTSEFSEFLYNTTNPLGGFTHLDFDGGTLVSAYSGNLSYFLTPKSNILVGDYDQPAQKAETTLNQIFGMLRDVFKVYWHVENGNLRLEHVSWYQKGGTYSTPIIGSDLTQLIQPRNNKNWNFAQNKWEFEKEDMPERFEYGWMDDVSLPFEGNAIEIVSNFVQRGKIEDMNVNNITSDIDFCMGNPQTVSRDGFCLISTVLVGGKYRVPLIEANLGYNSEVIMQNGFLSFLYLHPKFHTYDLPSDKVIINQQETTLFNNITKKKKQEVTYPATEVIDPYKLVRTDLGDGIVDKLKIDMESRMIKATIKHDTE